MAGSSLRKKKPSDSKSKVTSKETSRAKTAKESATAKSGKETETGDGQLDEKGINDEMKRGAVDSKGNVSMVKACMLG